MRAIGLKILYYVLNLFCFKFGDKTIVSKLFLILALMAIIDEKDTSQSCTDPKELHHHLHLLNHRTNFLKISSDYGKVFAGIQLINYLLP